VFEIPSKSVCETTQRFFVNVWFQLFLHLERMLLMNFVRKNVRMVRTNNYLLAVSE